MSATPNPHTMMMGASRNFITCAAEGCGYFSTHYDFPSRTQEANDASAAGLFNMHHRAQYDPGRAPDITVEYELVAYCSVCEDGIGDIQQNDGETVRCKECGTAWHIDGTNGEREEKDDE